MLYTTSAGRPNWVNGCLGDCCNRLPPYLTPGLPRRYMQKMRIQVAHTDKSKSRRHTSYIIRICLMCCFAQRLLASEYRPNVLLCLLVFRAILQPQAVKGPAIWFHSCGRDGINTTAARRGGESLYNILIVPSGALP